MKFYIVDCFAEEKYQGNELLVVIADRIIPDDEQKKIAREINFSETAFILSGRQPDDGYDVRIWTPNVGEVDFAGHPTLGAAYIIHQVIEGGKGNKVKLNLKAGQIPVRISGHGMTMEQNPPRFGTEIDRGEIAEVFGICPDEIRDDYPTQWVSTGLEAVIVPLKDRKALRGLSMDRDKFRKYVASHPDCNCNHLFFVDTGENTFAARCLMEDFIEDPATGSANGDLAGYLLKYGYFGSQDVSYRVYQGEDMGRRSVLHIHAARENDGWLIEVGGKCHIVASGNWD